MTTQALATRSNNTMGTLSPLDAAHHFVKSGYFRDASDESKAVVKILYGAEFGISPVTSMLNIHIIEGKPSMSAHMIGGVLRKAGYDFRVTTATNEACEITFLRGTDVLGSSSFTKEDASKAGLWGKANWAKFPKAMLFARCMSQGARMHCPDAFMGGIYTPDELGAEVEMDEAGTLLKVQDVTPARGQTREQATRPIPTEPAEIDNTEADKLLADIGTHLTTIFGKDNPQRGVFSKLILRGYNPQSLSVADMEAVLKRVREFKTLSDAQQWLDAQKPAQEPDDLFTPEDLSKPQASPLPGKPSEGPPATDKQVKAIRAIYYAARGWNDQQTDAECLRRFGSGVLGLTVQAARNLIEELKEAQKK